MAETALERLVEGLSMATTKERIDFLLDKYNEYKTMLKRTCDKCEKELNEIYHSVDISAHTQEDNLWFEYDLCEECFKTTNLGELNEEG